MIPQLREYQIDLYRRVCEARRKGSRIIVVQAATGAGKTSWASYVVARAVEKGNRVLFMVHRRALVNQISARLHEFQVDHGILMRGEQKDTESAVQVASRDTLLSRCLNNPWLGMPPAQVVLVDEGHHAHSEDGEYRRILERYPTATILLMSATPVGPDGGGLGPWAQAIECAAPTSQLVRDGFLCPVRCFAPDRRKRNGKIRKTGIAGDLVESWKSYAEGLATVLFCGRVQHSLDAVAAYNEAGIPAAHVDASTKDDERERVFEELAGGRIKVVGNVGIIGEGVDVPELGCCQLFCECGGRVAFLQRCGRIMRPYPGKQFGRLIDHAGAVFRHGFPDEDNEWTLLGNADADFVQRQKDDKNEKALYCRPCELLYHGTLACPQCGRMPQKPPRSVFAPPPLESTGELLTEVDRSARQEVFSKEEKIKHWLRCVATTFHKNGSFAQASVIYKQKYGSWPERDFPCLPQFGRLKDKVRDVYPDFGRRKKDAS